VPILEQIASREDVKLSTVQWSVCGTGGQLGRYVRPVVVPDASLKADAVATLPQLTAAEDVPDIVSLTLTATSNRVPSMESGVSSVTTDHAANRAVEAYRADTESASSPSSEAKYALVWLPPASLVTPTTVRLTAGGRFGAPGGSAVRAAEEDVLTGSATAKTHHPSTEEINVLEHPYRLSSVVRSSAPFTEHGRHGMDTVAVLSHVELEVRSAEELAMNPHPNMVVRVVHS